MNTQEQIENYIATQPERKLSKMRELHRSILELMPKCKLWFLDGKDDRPCFSHAAEGRYKISTSRS